MTWPLGRIEKHPWRAVGALAVVKSQNFRGKFSVMDRGPTCEGSAGPEIKMGDHAIFELTLLIQQLV